MQRDDSLKKDPDAEEDQGLEENGVTKDELVRQQHRINGYEYEKILGDSEGQGRLACCSLCSAKGWTQLSD